MMRQLLLIFLVGLFSITAKAQSYEFSEERLKTEWTGIKTYRYKDKGGVAVGSSSQAGELVSPDLELADQFVLSFEALGWNEEEVELIAEYGSQQQKVVLERVWSKEASPHRVSLVFDREEDVRNVKFKSAEAGKRFIVYYVSIKEGSTVLPVVSLSADTLIAGESGNSEIRLKIELSEVLDYEVSTELVWEAPSWAEASDFELSRTEVSFAPGRTEAEVLLKVVDDNERERKREILSLGLNVDGQQLEKGSRSKVTLVLLDDDYGKSPKGAESIFISKMLEGSGYDKFLELFNGTGGGVNLDGLYIFWSDGDKPIDFESDKRKVALSGELAHGETLLLVNKDSRTSPSLKFLADTLVGFSFNGDDRIGLFRKDGESFLPVDLLGKEGMGNVLKDKTLVRQKTVLNGVKLWALPDESEWEVLGKNDWSVPGLHEFEGVGPAFKLEEGYPKLKTVAWEKVEIYLKGNAKTELRYVLVKGGGEIPSLGGILAEGKECEVTISESVLTLEELEADENYTLCLVWSGAETVIEFPFRTASESFALSKTDIDFGEVLVGNVSVLESYEVRYSIGSGEVKIVAPEGFGLSLSPEGPFSNSLNIPVSGESSIRIFIRFEASVYNENQVESFVSHKLNGREMEIRVMAQTKKRVQKIVLPYLKELRYGMPPQAFAVSATSGLPVKISISDEGVCGVEDGYLNIKNAGNVTVTLSQEGDGVYEAVSVDMELDIQRADLVVGVVDAEIEFGEEYVPELTFSGFVNGDTEDSLFGEPVFEINEGEVTVSGYSSVNYNILYEYGRLTILPGEQTLAVNQPSDKVYGDAYFVLDASSSSGMLPEFESLTPGIVTVNNEGGVLIVGAGEAKLRTSQSGSGRYKPAEPVEVSFLVKKAPLEVKALDATIRYGEDELDFEVEYSGFVYADGPEDLKGELVFDLVGDRVMPQGLTSSNYEITFVGGLVTVLPPFSDAKEILSLSWRGEPVDFNPSESVFVLEITEGVFNIDELDVEVSDKASFEVLGYPENGVLKIKVVAENGDEKVWEVRVVERQVLQLENSDEERLRILGAKMFVNFGLGSELRVLSLNGRVCRVFNGVGRRELSCEGLASGVYVVTLIFDGSVLVRRFRVE
ncbi:hypothetical protein FUAX_25030 [Fulvitalea axinellae]|uniref:MBG domain-containing protein n=1 Tax=Fulvitalea axinellae TaxID=1182444 RepID=A0AAU9CD87_9BACT|nr:hypothetical protein FUAX_25030 [Fulvitalea axinellae]